MLQPVVLGLADSPGSLVLEREQAAQRASQTATGYAPTTFLPTSSYGRSVRLTPSDAGPSSVSSRSHSHHLAGIDDGYEEELVWSGLRVVWSRGGQVHKQFSFKDDFVTEDAVTFALFAHFQPPEVGPRHEAARVPDALNQTFGPFHRSKDAKWSTPRQTRSTSSTSRPVRSLVIFLKQSVRIYSDSGQDHIVHLPFEVDHAWALETGGVMVQRALSPREQRKLRRRQAQHLGQDPQQSFDFSNMSILDDLEDMEGRAPSKPRLYTLSGPFDEFKPVVVTEQGDLADWRDSEPCLDVLGMADAPYPLVVLWDSGVRQILFARRVLSSSSAPNDQFLGGRHTKQPRSSDLPGDILLPPRAAGPRPSLTRNPSGMANHLNERRASGAADPLDRTTRRSQRVSRGGAGGTEGRALIQPETASGELQAALHPDPQVAPAAPRRRTRAGRSSLGLPVEQEGQRRESGSTASFMREDSEPAPTGLPGLLGAAEKDIRETTMIMGLEREEGLRSDTILDVVWSWDPPEPFDPQCAHVFVSENISPGHCLLNVHIKDRLYTFAAEMTSGGQWRINPVRCVECVAAVPVISTRLHVLDTLVLLADGSLSILTCDGHPLPVRVPPLDEHDGAVSTLATLDALGRESPLYTYRQPTDTRIVALDDPVGHVFTARLADGRSLRMSADFRPRQPLVRQCIGAISFVLPRDQIAIFIQQIAVAASSAETSQGHAWAIFAQALSQVLGLQQGTPPTVQDRRPGRAFSILESLNRELAPLDKTVSPSAPVPESVSAEPCLATSSLPAVLLALHLVGQECRLLQSSQRHLQDVSDILVRLAHKLGKLDWADYWLRLVPQQVAAQAPNAGSVGWPASFPDFPPDILEYLSRRLTQPLRPFPSLQTIPGCQPCSLLGEVMPCRHTQTLCEIYDCVGPSIDRQSVGARAEATIRCLVEKGLTHEWLADVAPGLALPILEMVRHGQSLPRPTYTAEMLDFVYRKDLAMKDQDWRAAHPLLPDMFEPGKEPEGKHVRFTKDKRLAEVERIMQTVNIRTIRLVGLDRMTDAQVANACQAYVNTLAMRTLAITVGQGSFRYGTVRSVVDSTIRPALLELGCRVLPLKTVLHAQVVMDHTDWPRFHNGVSSALAVSPDAEGIDSAWIELHRPEVLSAEHGGVLLGLGLNGHLRKLLSHHAFPFLEPRHDFTSIGLLLGLGASFAGSQDLLVTKVLSLHTHALLPMGSMELNAPPLVQCAALLGLGLVYAGSKRLRMAEVTLNEVGRPIMPGVDKFAEHVEAYSFSAAMAFGLIMLGQGGAESSEVDRRLLTRLQRCIQRDEHGAKHADESPFRDDIDPAMTAPGATLALGLMFLRTGRTDARDMLPIPADPIALEQVRPDVLLLRVLARSLIMWDEITPTRAWIESHLPPFIDPKEAATAPLKLEHSWLLAYMNIVAGACMAVALKHAGTASEMAYVELVELFHAINRIAGSSGRDFEGEIRRSAARQCLGYVSLALSVVMSGTGEKNVFRRLRVSHGTEGHGITYGTHMASHLALGILFLGKGFYTLGNSNLAIAAMVIAFFPRFAPVLTDNSAYPQAFRHLWALAAEPRCISARDVDTGQTISLPIKVRWKDSDKALSSALVSPTLVAPFDRIMCIDTDTVRYEFVRYDLSDPRDREALIRTRTIFVKRRGAFQDYETDPKGNNGILIRLGTLSGMELRHDMLSPAVPSGLKPEQFQDIIRHFATSRTYHGLARILGHESTEPDAPADSHPRKGVNVPDMLRHALLECMCLNKPYALPVYMAIACRSDWPVQVEARRNEDLMFAFSGLLEKGYMLEPARDRSMQDKRPYVIRPSLLASLANRPILTGESEDISRYLTTGNWPVEHYARCDLAEWLQATRVPTVQMLSALMARVQQHASGIDARSSEMEKRRSIEALALKVRVAATRYEAAARRAWDSPSSADSGSSEEENECWRSQWHDSSLRTALSAWSGVR